MGGRRFTISKFVCNECGNVLPLPRKNNRQRKDGHIKTIFCPFCNGKRQFVETKGEY